MVAALARRIDRATTIAIVALALATFATTSLLLFRPTIEAESVGTIHLKDGAVTTVKILDGAITQEKIADNSITGPKIAPNAVGAGKIAEGAVGSEEIADGSIVNADISPDAAISGAKIAANSITSQQLDNGSVTSVELADGAVTSPKLANGSVTLEKLAPEALARMPTLPLGTENLANNAVTYEKMAIKIKAGKSLVKDGDKIAHELGRIPTSVVLTLSDVDEDNWTVFVRSVNAENIEVGLLVDGASWENKENVYWIAVYTP